MNKLVAALLGLGVTLGASAQGAHEHGVAELQVAVDGGQLSVELSTPLDNLVGFEHAPRTAAQRAALADAQVRLRAFERLFALPPAAGCVLREVDIESPWAEEDGHGHADDHADDHGHGHADDHDEAHGDLHVQYSLECANPSALTELQVKLSEAFPRMQRVRAATATARGQGSATLSQSRNTLPL